MSRFLSSTSLKTRFSLFLSFCFLVSLCAFALFVYRQASHKSLSMARQSLQAVVEHEWEHIDLEAHVMEVDPTHPVAPHFKDIYLRIRKNGDLIYDSFPKAFPLEKNSEQYLFHKANRTIRGEAFELEGYYDLSSTFTSLSVLKRTLISGCFLAFLLMIPLSLLVAKILLKPFRVLARETSTLSAENLSFRFPEPKVEDEFGMLTRNFNGLLNRLDRSFQQVKGFAFNASHELRTPLAVIISQGEMALRRERSSEEYRTALEKMVTPAKQLREITSRLLVLAEVHRLESDAKLVEINPDEMIRQAIETLRNAYPERNELKFAVNPATDSFQGRKEIFQIVLANLLENAVKFAARDVRVICEKESDRVSLVVEDDGPGMNKGNAESSDARKGAGLGLSIVKACLDSIEGTLRFGSSSLGGVRAEVFVPLIKN